ncbi:uncharacterized protein N7506_001900 [Penicillium brevicompactum]|uniref:uncharacterized protein n=1 Tax=Penicillium brevicompactum TaxID=5074 RepID=UPI0025405BB6|nr:uncharacterized protein N7506_001900 [Penicillium brevicompactum]KAJ5348647.1 hypothetical protein N7506_001900 [Penicillium brevicompactum]
MEVMRKELFDVLLEQAVIASQTAVKIIAKCDEINKVVLSSSADEDFLKSNGNLRPNLQYSLGGGPSWCYTSIVKPESMHIAFPRLLVKAVRGYLTTFLPSEGSTDGLIRVMVMFDQSLLQSLFGCPESDTMAAGEQLSGRI